MNHGGDWHNGTPTDAVDGRAVMPPQKPPSISDGLAFEDTHLLDQLELIQ